LLRIKRRAPVPAGVLGVPLWVPIVAFALTLAILAAQLLAA
jgi:hypothetical protein